MPSSIQQNLPPYSKPHLNFDQQIKQLKTRKMIIEDDIKAKEILSQVGYYYMSGYWYPYRETNIGTQKKEDFFVSDVKIEEVYNLLLFDKQLKMLLFSMTEDIEIALRCRIAYHIGYRDRFAHTKKGFFTKKALNPNIHKEIPYDKWEKRLDNQIEHSAEDFCIHYKTTYSRPLPLWICCHLWDFGMMSNFYKMLKQNHQQVIANSLDIANESLLESWLQSINHIRNICAHNGRLWNRTLIAKPKLIRDNKATALDFLSTERYDISRPAAIIMIIVWLIRKIAPQSQSHQDLFLHLCEFLKIDLPGIGLDVMGFKDNWESKSIWY